MVTALQCNKLVMSGGFFAFFLRAEAYDMLRKCERPDLHPEDVGRRV
jgi:hypothetical protein